MAEINERFNAQHIRDDLVTAKRMRRLYDSFWDGEEGLKAGREILGTKYNYDPEDVDKDLSFDDFQAVVLSGNVLKTLSKSIRASLDSVVGLIPDDKKSDWNDDSFDSVYLAKLVDADGFENGEDPRKEEVSDVEKVLRTSKLDILKVGTLNAIFQGCKSFDECKAYFNEWNSVKGIEKWYTDEFFAIWLAKSRSWEEKSEVLRTASTHGIGYTSRVGEGFFKGLFSRSRREFLDNVFTDEELKDDFFCEDFVTLLISLNPNGHESLKSWSSTGIEYDVDMRTEDAIALFDNIPDRDVSFIFKSLRDAGPTTKCLITNIKFINGLLLAAKDHKRRMLIVTVAVSFEVDLDKDSVEILIDATNDLRQLRGIMPIVKTWADYAHRPVERSYLDKIVSIAYYESFEEILEVTGEMVMRGIKIPINIFDNFSFTIVQYKDLMEMTSSAYKKLEKPNPIDAAMHYAKTGEMVDGFDQVHFMEFMLRCVRGVALEEGDYACYVDAVGREPKDLIPLIVRLLNDGGVPTDEMKKYVEGLDIYSKERLKKAIVDSSIMDGDVSFENSWMLHSIGIEFDLVEDGKEEGEDFTPWLEMYGSLRPSTSNNLALDFSRRLELCWKEDISPDESFLDELKTIKKPDRIVEILKSLERFVSVDGGAIESIEDEKWKAIFVYLKIRVESEGPKKKRARVPKSRAKGVGKKKKVAAK